MKPFLILYFSGVGNTKSAAEEIYNTAKAFYRSEIYSVEKLPQDFSMDNYSAVIIGTPVYHSEPALPVMEFLDGVKCSRNIPAFIFSTYGLYSGNTLRILAKKCLEHRIIPIHSTGYRFSATDGILIAPFMECWSESDYDLPLKLPTDFMIFLKKLQEHSPVEIPKMKWYTPLNYPNKLIGQKTTFPIYLHRDICMKCGKCIRNCPKNAITEKRGYPIFNKELCINCYRCIHHCPAMALSLSKRRAVEKVWHEALNREE